MKKKTYRRITEITELEQATLIEFIHREWICPAHKDELDEEDLARAHLIEDLRVKFGVNDEAIPLILHLLDQLYHLREQISRFRT